MPLVAHSNPAFASFQSPLHLVTNRFWKKLPLMTLNLRLYESQQQEEKCKPISRYPVPYEKDLPFDI